MGFHIIMEKEWRRGSRSGLTGSSRIMTRRGEAPTGVTIKTRVLDTGTPLDTSWQRGKGHLKKEKKKVKDDVTERMIKDEPAEKRGQLSLSVPPADPSQRKRKETNKRQLLELR